jgi:hypothetical protein
MLRRQGIASVMSYGAAPDPQSGLSAHVWLRADDIDVVGGEIASRYAVLATFPRCPSAPMKYHEILVEERFRQRDSLSMIKF